MSLTSHTPLCSSWLIIGALPFAVPLPSRWAVAAKFGALRKSTVLLGIEVQVGRSGALTPVAVLAPVALGGNAVVRRATLHNEVSVTVSVTVSPRRAALRAQPLKWHLHACGALTVCPVVFRHRFCRAG